MSQITYQSNITFNKDNGNYGILSSEPNQRKIHMTYMNHRENL